MAARKILVTGGAGFIGFNLVEALIKEGHGEIVVVDNLFRGTDDSEFEGLLKHPSVKFLQLDLTDPGAYARIGDGYDQIFHLASINGTRHFYEMPHEVLRVNTLIMIYLLEWMRRQNPRGKLLFTSSNETYAGALEAFDRLPLPTPEDVPLVIADPFNPRWSYGGAKLINELCMIHYAQRYTLRGVIVRPHNFYGPRDMKDHVVPDFLARIVSRKDPFPIYGAANTRDFTFISDAVQAMISLMNSQATDDQPIEIVHIGNGTEISMKEVANHLFEIAGWWPKTLDIREAPKGSVERRVADISKAKRIINWEATTPLTDGLRLTYEWYVNVPRISH